MQIQLSSNAIAKGLANRPASRAAGKADGSQPMAHNVQLNASSSQKSPEQALKEMAAQAAVPQSFDPNNPQSGFACGTFLRPDPIFSDAAQLVVHAHQAGNNPHGLREFPYGRFQVIRTADLLAGKKEVLIGFGSPKVFTVVPRADGEGYERLNASPVFEHPATVANGDVLQSGVFIRPRNLPDKAVDALRKAMEESTHHRSLSTTRANAKALSQAGFTAGGHKLDGQFLPAHLFLDIANNGLEFQGQPVKFDIVSTTPASLDEHFREVVKGEIGSIFHGGDDTPASPLPAGSGDPIAALGQKQDPNAPKVRIRVSRVSMLGNAIRTLAHAHMMFEAVGDQKRVDINKYLPKRLLDKFSTGEKLSTKEKIKKAIFTPAKVKFIRATMAESFDEAGEFSPQMIAKMIRQPGPGEELHADKDGHIKYNIVISGDKSERGNRVVIARLKTTDEDNKADDILSKHVLISGYDQDVRFAGEMWAETYVKEDGSHGVRIHVSNNSGTYRPTGEQAVAACDYLSHLFEGVEFVPEKVDPAPKPKTKPDYLRNFAVTGEEAAHIHDDLDGKKVTLHDASGHEKGFTIRPFKTMEFDTTFYDTANKDILNSGGMLRTRTRYKSVGGEAIKDIDLEAKMPNADGSPYNDRAKGASYKTPEEWNADAANTLASRGDNAVNLARTVAGKTAPLEPVISKNSERELFFVSPNTPIIGRLAPSFLVMIDKNETRPVDEPRKGQPGAQPHEDYFVVTPEIFTKLPWTKKITPDRIAQMEDLADQLADEYHLTESTQSAYQEAASHH